MASAKFGCGTYYYGKYDKKPDGSHTHIEWVVLCMLPIFPLKATRVKDLGTSHTSVGASHNYRTSYELLGPGRRSWVSIGLHYLITVAVLVFFIGAFINGNGAGSPSQ